MNINIKEYRQYQMGGVWNIEVEVETPYQTLVIKYSRKKLNDAKRVFSKRIGADVGNAIHDDIMTAYVEACKR